ncbi:MAG: Bax inhibitor-1/YccA family protein [Bacteroidia bacterium]|nr:Bax inhibitor-1/YccA family protein [Bacteroidia bacterium]
MENNNYSITDEKSITATFMTKVYSWMTLALAITGFIAMYVASSEELLGFIFGTKYMFLGLIIAELGVVWFLSARVAKLNYSTAVAMFILYSCLSGLTLSVVFIIYTASSIASTFFITAGTFAVMSLAGFYTKKDLSGFGSIMMMGLVGVIIATVVNFFLKSEMLNYIISYIGVMVFVGLTAYDTQKIKLMATQVDGENAKKASIMGALTLYLDFVNLFLYLLRVMGNRK